MNVTNVNSLAESLAKEVCQARGYRFDTFLGRGGMGDVFKITDAAGRPFALKILRDADPLAPVLFSSEIEALKKHGNAFTVALHDYGEGRCCWYVMDYFPENLRGWIHSHPDPQKDQDQGIGFFGQALRGLAAWHTGTLTICHGDLNPANILLDGAANRAVLSDPSLASIRGPHGTNYTNQRPRQGGTPGFVDPNPLTSGSPQGDVYQAGATLYALLVRQAEPPVSGLIESVRADETLPEAFKAVILRCIDPDLSRRYKDAGELSRGFDSARNPLPANPPRAAKAPRLKWMAPHRRTVIRTAEAAALVLTILSSLYTLRQVFHWHLLVHESRAARARETAPSAKVHPGVTAKPGAAPVVPDEAAAPVPAKSAATTKTGRRVPSPVLPHPDMRPGSPAANAGPTPQDERVETPSSTAKRVPVHSVASTPGRPTMAASHPPGTGKTLQTHTADYVGLGDKAQNRGDLQEAQRLYRLAVTSKPQDPAPHRALGLLYRHVHDDAGARDHLVQYLRLAPTASDRQEIEQIIHMLEP